MKIRVQYTAQLRTALGRGEEEVELPEGSTLAGLVVSLVEMHGSDASVHLTTTDGAVRASVLMFVNNEGRTAQDAAGTSLCSGDVVLLLVPIAGG